MGQIVDWHIQPQIETQKMDKQIFHRRNTVRCNDQYLIIKTKTDGAQSSYKHLGRNTIPETGAGLVDNAACKSNIKPTRMRFGNAGTSPNECVDHHTHHVCAAPRDCINSLNLSEDSHLHQLCDKSLRIEV